MIRPKGDDDHADRLLRDEPDSVLMRRNRVAGVVFVLVLLGVSSYAVWSSQATSAAATEGIAADGLSDDFERAAGAVNAEESLERKYRLEPGPEVRAHYDSAAADLAPRYRCCSDERCAASVPVTDAAQR